MRVQNEPLRVLVVEDHVVLANRIGEGLRDAGFAVDVVHDGAAALQSTTSTDYDVVVLDRDLPVVHGDRVCRQRRRAARTRVGHARRRVQQHGRGDHRPAAAQTRRSAADRDRRRRRLPVVRRHLSARSRLTLVYTSLFALGGAALVLVTYLLVAHSLHSTTTIRIRASIQPALGKCDAAAQIRGGAGVLDKCAALLRTVSYTSRRLGTSLNTAVPCLSRPAVCFGSRTVVRPLTLHVLATLLANFHVRMGRSSCTDIAELPIGSCNGSATIPGAGGVQSDRPRHSRCRRASREGLGVDRSVRGSEHAGDRRTGPGLRDARDPKPVTLVERHRPRIRRFKERWAVIGVDADQTLPQ